MKTPKPIKKMSVNRSSEANVYAKKKKAFLAANEYCAVCGAFTYPGDRDLHHRRGRAGKLYLDERFWLMVCGGMTGCHNRIHLDPKWAIASGFLGGKGEWGVCP